MTRLMDITGTVFGRLTVIGRAPNSEAGQTRWHCRCECGNEIVAQGGALKAGHTKSCSCLSVEAAVKRSTKHGHANSEGASPTYWTWAGMLARCTNPNHKAFKRYGARGVRVCERWREFASFLADMGEKPIGRSLDRIDNSKGYEPGNCRWATPTEQARNKRNIRQLTVNGVTKPLVEWAEMVGIHPSSLLDRLKYGWPVEQAVSLPPSAEKRARLFRGS